MSTEKLGRDPLDSWKVRHHAADMGNLNILKDVERFVRKTGMAESTLGKKALNDGKAIARLRAGGRMWPETLDKLRDYMKAESRQDRAA